MADAFADRLSRDSRTSFGEPVDPEVLISSATSGCRSWPVPGRRSRSAQPSPAMSTTSGSYAAVNDAAAGGASSTGQPAVSAAK